MVTNKIDKIVLALLELQGIGRKTARNIASSLSINLYSLESLHELIAEGIEKKVIRSTYSQSEVVAAVKSAEMIDDQLEQTNGICISFLNPNFPKYLNDIENPPAVLFTQGNPELLNFQENVAVVGTREPTEHAVKAGERLSEILIQSGYNIVSGLAIGCDSIAHKAALKFNGKTLAVLPAGLFSIYPRSNQGLSAEIVENGGLLVTEYSPKSTPQKNNFIDRDRLQSAFSKALFVLETDVKGGTMHTVRFALNQHRPIACLLSHPEELLSHPKVQGNLMIEKEQWGTAIRTKGDLEGFLKVIAGNSPISSMEKPAHTTRKSGAQKGGRGKKSKTQSSSQAQTELPF